MISVAPAQVQAVLPFGLAPSAHQLVLVDLTGASPPLAVPSLFIGMAAPEVVTTNNSATGPASLFKLTSNRLQQVTATNPAVPGDKIQFNATGLGAVSPAVPAGSFIAQNDTSHVVTSPVTLKIGGVVAQVTSARLAPGNNGQYLVEAMVPPGLGTVGGGVAPLSLELSVNGAMSGPGATAFFQTQSITTVTMNFATSPYDGLTLNVNGTSHVTPPYPGFGLQFLLGAPVTVQIPNPQFLPGNTSTRYAVAFSSDNPATAVFPAANVLLGFDFVAQNKLTLNAPSGGSLSANPPASGGFYSESVSGAPSSVTLTGACGPLQDFIAFNIQQPNVAAIPLTLNPGTIAVNAPTTVSVVCGAPTWTLTNPLSTARYAAGATLLPSGKALVAGGYGPGGVSDRPLAVEIYDPATDTWTTTTPLPAGHALNAIRLLTGEVLVVGDEANVSEPAHVYNETGATWTSTGVPNVRRFSPVTALLTSGNVLMAGGYNGGCCYGDAGNYETAEIYNRSSNIWTPTGSMATKRTGFTATVLPSGKVLAAGGYYRDTQAIRNSAEIYDPVVKTWSPAASMFNARAGHTATRLPSGQVLVVGGLHTSFSDFTPTAELYNPATGNWVSVGSLAVARSAHTATLLPNGKVLVTGGYNSSGLLTSSELYDPATSQWTAGPDLVNGRAGATATLLPNGKVLAAGGHNPATAAVLTSAELYH